MGFGGTPRNRKIQAHATPNFSAEGAEVFEKTVFYAKVAIFGQKKGKVGSNLDHFDPLHKFGPKFAEFYEICNKFQKNFEDQKIDFSP